MSEALIDNTKPAFFIGIDSDGTTFDTMEIKHKRVFQPMAIEIWGLEPYASSLNEISEKINLYSTSRGVNRFQGLTMTLERLSARHELPEAIVSGIDALKQFVLSGVPLSADNLKRYNETKKHPFIDEVLIWSRRSDELYSQIMDSEGNPPYPGVMEALQKMASDSEITIISSSARGALMQDWGDAGLLKYIKEVKGQETGSKSKQLASALQAHQIPEKALMIGDAIGDLEAARANGILFYPIIPGAEAESWSRFRSEALGHFYEGRYAGTYQQELLDNFYQILAPDEPWPAETCTT